MEIIDDNGTLKRVIMVGDKILIRPKESALQTKSGLFLPPSVADRENVSQGYVIKVGPGYPIPFLAEDEPWKQTPDEPKYVPLQPKEGDLAIFLQKNALEVELDGDKFLIVSQASILMLVRENEYFQ